MQHAVWSLNALQRDTLNMLPIIDMVKLHFQAVAWGALEVHITDNGEQN